MDFTGQSLDVIITVGAIIIGILLVTGNGGIFLKGGNEQLRREKYDEDKLAKAAGVAFILSGIATGLSMMWDTSVGKMVYLTVIVIIFGVLFYYIKTKCSKK